jgi:hypothetical protein
VQRGRRSSVEGETEYAFKHLLVRDVAYGQIPRAERARKHVETAEWIESLGRPEDQAEMVAHHYATALELAVAAGEDVDELAPRARRAFRDAGDRAATLHALPAAERYYADALALTPDEDPERPDLLFRHGQMRWHQSEEGAEEIQEVREAFLEAGDRERAAEAALFLAQVAWREGRRDGMREHMDDASALVADMPPSRIQAAVLCEASRYEMLADRSDRAVELGREALRLADELGLDEIRAKALINVGTSRAGAGEPDGFHDLEAGIELAQQINLVSEVIRGKNNFETRTALAGDFTLARRLIVEVRELAQRYGYLNFVRFLDGASGIAPLRHWASGASVSSAPMRLCAAWRRARRTTRLRTRTAVGASSAWRAETTKLRCSIRRVRSSLPGRWEIRSSWSLCCWTQSACTLRRATKGARGRCSTRRSPVSESSRISDMRSSTRTPLRGSDGCSAGKRRSTRSSAGSR